jgi:hypothetical protein
MDPATLTKVEVAHSKRKFPLISSNLRCPEEDAHGSSNMSMDPASLIKVEVALTKRKRPLISSNLRCPEEDAHGSSKRGRRLSKPLLLSDLGSCWHLSLNEAAGHLGVCTSALKKEARRLVFYSPPPSLPPFTFAPHCSLSPSSSYTVLIFSCMALRPIKHL